MPYIKKHYDTTNAAVTVYSGATATLSVPNKNGASYGMLHYTAGSKLACAILSDLLTEAGIAFTKVSDYVFDIWGLKFALLHSVGSGNVTTYGPASLAVIPYGNCQYPIYANTANTSGQGRNSNNWCIANSYWIYWNGSDGNKTDCTGYLYYNENCIHFAMRNTNNAGRYKFPVFYIFKGTTLDGHNCAIMGGSPSGHDGIQTSSNTTVADYSGIINHGATLFDLDDITHLFGIDYRLSTTNINPFPQANVGQFGNDYLLDNLVLKPVSDWCYNGYVKINNVYYPDYYAHATDSLYDRVIELNGIQYYIPLPYMLSNASARHTYGIGYHPVAIKL